jgi:hypothetical protein
MVRRMDETIHLKTSRSNSFRFLRSRAIAARRMSEMIYSLIFLNGVSPTPSTKQRGKMFQYEEKEKGQQVTKK